MSPSAITTGTKMVSGDWDCNGTGAASFRDGGHKNISAPVGTQHVHMRHLLTHQLYVLPCPTGRWAATEKTPGTNLTWTDTRKHTHKRMGVCHVHWPTDYTSQHWLMKTHQAHIGYWLTRWKVKILVRHRSLAGSHCRYFWLCQGNKRLVMKAHTPWKADSHSQQDRKMSWHMETWTWPPPA